VVEHLHLVAPVQVHRAAGAFGGAVEVAGQTVEAISGGQVSFPKICAVPNDGTGAVFGSETG